MPGDLLLDCFDLARDVRQAPTWRARLGYVFGPPGWSHDGSRMTTEQYREHLREQRASHDTRG